jgi:hypothetical protein
MDAFNEKEMRDIDQLHSELMKIEDTQNNVDISEFNYYSPLFRKADNLSKEKIRELSDQFFRRFNVYKPIVVFQEGEEIFRVPQLFIEINDVSKEHTNLVDNFRTHGVSDVPKYAQEATYGLLAAILKSQEDVSEKGFKSYGEYINHLSNEYRRDVEAFTQVKDNVPVEKQRSHKDIDINDIDGLVWK